ncbi:MAG: FG-GAP-like repeat-containing protein [Acidobacteriota bacterium]|nr:FG-GAP-like repeat-containing protein [Acidobacteriota bacterium]
MSLGVVLWTLGGHAQKPEVEEERLWRAVALRSSALADMESLNFGRASETLEELERLLPDNLLPKVNLAICQFRLNQDDVALETIARARAIDPDNPQALFTLARILGERASDDIEARRRWDRILRRMILLAPNDPRPYFLRARVLAARDLRTEAVTVLNEAVRRDPDNLVLLLDRLVNAAESGDLQATADALDGVEDRLNGFSDQQSTYADRVRDAVFEQDAAALRPPAQVLQNLLRPSGLYQVGLAALQGRQGGLFLFPQLDFYPGLPTSLQGGADLEIAFAEQKLAPWSQVAGAVELVVERMPGTEAVLVRKIDGTIERISGAFSDGTGLQSRGPMISADIDQDERTDVVVTTATDVRMYSGGRSRGTPLISTQGRKVSLIAATDIEQDGDLDVLVSLAESRLRVLQNGGGTWKDVAADLGLDQLGVVEAVTSVDLDLDDDLDLVLASEQRGLRVLINRRAGSFVDASEAWRAPARGRFDRLLELDLEGDGDLDLIAAGSPTIVLRNEGGIFATAEMSLALASAITADLDNDGDLDMAGIAGGGELVLVRNQAGQMVPMTGALVEPQTDVVQVVSHDVDDDGDLDLLALTSEGEIRSLLNEGANRNQWLRLSLQGRNDSNAKNNTQGLFARIEVRTGTRLQTYVGNGGINHIGLGASRQADVIRVVWTNGVSQTFQQVAAKQTLLEKQVLKGSCPFLYTWNGSKFDFHTDLMWRSTLGMRFWDGTAAPHQSARDYVLIPGDQLLPAGDELWLQMTDELWETLYVDRQELLAVDVPRGHELIVDESFGPPPFPTTPPILLADELIAPVSATDHAGRDVTEDLRYRDGRRVMDLPLTRYQGLARQHALELEFPPVSGDLPSHLVMWGWIFPTDTTINVALSQNESLDPQPPWIEVRNGRGGVVARLALPLPNGKRKAVLVPLPADHSGFARELRKGLQLVLYSHHELYWDRAALALASAAKVRMHRLTLRAADLHYRGFSRQLPRLHSQPHLFDYEAVMTAQRWQPMSGNYTRYGSVLPLLFAADDHYVIMSPGDELTLRYAAAPEPPETMSRAYILFTDGWVKDGDLQTTASQTVEPLPYHGMARYPDVPQHRFPDGDADRANRLQYQTRVPSTLRRP